MSKNTAKKFWQWLSRQPDNPEAQALAEFLDDEGSSLHDDEGSTLRHDDTKDLKLADFTKSPEWIAVQKKLADQEAQIASFAKSGTSHTADKALAKLVGKITPAQQPALLALFTQAAQDDTDAAIVTFSVEGQAKPFEGSRVDALLAVFAGQGDIKLTEELLDDSKHATFGAKGKDAVPTMNPYTMAAEYDKQQAGAK